METAGMSDPILWHSTPHKPYPDQQRREWASKAMLRQIGPDGSAFTAEELAGFARDCADAMEAAGLNSWPDPEQAAAAESKPEPTIDAPGFPNRARVRLRAEGVTTLRQVADMSDAQLLNIPGFGRRTLMEVRAELRRHGIGGMAP